MKCNLPLSFNKLPRSEQENLQKALNERVNHLVDREEAEVQEIWIKLACILLHETFGFGEERLCRFIAAWDRIYRKNASTQTKAEQTEWLDSELKKCFPKIGFPQRRIDRLKDKT